MKNSSKERPEITFGLREAVDVSSIVTKADKEGVITFANDNFCKISGFTREELIGQPHSIVRHPDTPSSTFKAMWNTIESKKIWNGIVKNKHKDGSSYYVTATVTPSLDENNEIIEYISIRRDVTELHLLKNNLEKRVDEEIEKNRKKDEDALANISLFLDSTPNPIIVVGEDQNIRFVNKAFLTLLSISKEEMMKRECNLSSLLVHGNNYIYKEEDLVFNKENKIAIVTEHGKNIFLLYYTKINDINGNILKMYTLNNITKSEYQKLKIDHYNEQLQEFYNRSKVKSTVDTVEDEAKSEIIKETRKLNDEEKTLLHREHSSYAVSSVEYANDLDEYILSEIQELDELEIEIFELIDELEDKNLESMHKIVMRLFKFSEVLHNMIEFKELSFSLSSLADLLDKQDISALDETAYKKSLLFLKNITLDLSSWRNIVFIEQSANDIHYMDASLFSSILQLELVFNTTQQHEADEDDFELF